MSVSLDDKVMITSSFQIRLRHNYNGPPDVLLPVDLGGYLATLVDDSDTAKANVVSVYRLSRSQN